MPRQAKGSVYEARGRWYVALSVGGGKRRHVHIAAASNEAEARARGELIASAVARLRKAGRSDVLDAFVEQLAATSGPRLAAVQTVLDELLGGVVERADVPVEVGETFGELAGKWLAGELHRSFPDHVREIDHDHVGNRSRLTKYVLPIVGNVPLKAFTLDHAEEVMRRRIPKKSRRHIAQLLVRVCRLAVYPAKVIPVSPIPVGWLPKPGKQPMGVYLYPDEDRALLGCTKIPLVRRMIEGLLAREGMRASEAANLERGDLDLQLGAIRLEENKTDDPRAWALSAGVRVALRLWLEMIPESQWVFPDPEGEGPFNVRHLAKQLRADLKRAGVEREVLFAASENRMRLRAHDLRATFITLSLANGKTEQWVADRTGHKSSVMIQRYRRAARTAAELGLGELAPLAEVIPELSRIVDGGPPRNDVEGGAMQTTKNEGATGGTRTRMPVEALEPKSSEQEASHAISGDPESEARSGSPEILPDRDDCDASATVRRLAKTPLGRASLKAIEAAKSGDPDALLAALDEVAAEHAAADRGEDGAS